jgi:arsenate reductase
MCCTRDPGDSESEIPSFCGRPALVPGRRSLLNSRPMEVQIFGIRKSADTRKALRFFAERRVKTHFVDLQERPASPGELKRFAQRFGVAALVDRDSRRFADLGLAAARLSDEGWLDKLAAEPMLLRMPLARQGSQLSIGDAVDAWRSWTGK